MFDPTARSSRLLPDANAVNCSANRTWQSVGRDDSTWSVLAEQTIRVSESVSTGLKVVRVTERMWRIYGAEPIAPVPNEFRRNANVC